MATRCIWPTADRAWSMPSASINLRARSQGQRMPVTVPEHVGAPDGLTVDAGGDIWVAIL